MAEMKLCIIADLDVTPIGLEGPSVGKYVAEVVNGVKRIQGLRVEVTPMGTILEAEKLATILEAVEVAHEVLLRLGVKRVYTTLKIDDRRDKPRTKEDKLSTIEAYMKTAASEKQQSLTT